MDKNLKKFGDDKILQKKYRSDGKIIVLKVLQLTLRERVEREKRKLKNICAIIMF